MHWYLQGGVIEVYSTNVCGLPCTDSGNSEAVVCAVHSVHFLSSWAREVGVGEQVWEVRESHTTFPNSCVQTTNEHKSAAFTVSAWRR